MTTIAFDIDGTIFDCGDIVARAFSDGARTFGAECGIVLPDYSSEEIIRVVGQPTEEIFRQLYPALNKQQRQELMRKSQAALSKMVREGGGNIIAGVIPTIEALFHKGYRICAASNGTREYIEAILETHNIAQFFLPRVVLDGMRNNKSDLVRYYIEASPAGERFIMIGDRQSDIDAARDNEIPFIGCAFGHMGSSEIEKEKWIARKFEDIPRLIREIEKLYKY